MTPPRWRVSLTRIADGETFAFGFDTQASAVAFAVRWSMPLPGGISSPYIVGAPMPAEPWRLPPTDPNLEV